MNRPLSLQWVMHISLAALTLAGCVTSAPANVATTPPPTRTPVLANTPQPTNTTAATPTSEPPTDTPSPTTISQVVVTAPTQPTVLPSPPPAALSPVATATLSAPTMVPSFTADPASPKVISFTVTPTTTLTLGETLSFSWEAIGEQAAICSIWGTGPVKCQDVPLAGTMTMVTDEEIMAYFGFGLRATTGTTVTWSVVDVHMQCQGFRDWFFENPPERCPDAVPIYSKAAAQDFEHGFMIWTEQPDQFYVFFDDHEFLTVRAPYTIVDGEPVNETPPIGTYEPVSGFGKVWRGEIEPFGTLSVRQRLGWATGPESGFDTAYQCIIPPHPHLWDCYLRGPSGELLHLHPDSSAQVRFLWEKR